MATTRQEALLEMMTQLRAVALQVNELTKLATHALGLADLSQPMSIIIAEVARDFGVDRASILSRRQSRTVSVPRHLAYHLCVELCGASYSEVGLVFKRDHATIIYGHKAVCGWKGPLGARRDAVRERLIKMLELESMMGDAA